MIPLVAVNGNLAVVSCVLLPHNRISQDRGHLAPAI